MRVRGGRVEERGGGQLIGKLKNKWRLGGRSETGFTCCRPPVTRFTQFPAAAAGPKLPKTSLIKVPTCATLQRARDRKPQALST